MRVRAREAPHWGKAEGSISLYAYKFFMEILKSYRLFPSESVLL